jgi:hypothetical protein
MRKPVTILALFIVLGPLLAYLLFGAVALALYQIGGCSGALGSGVTCAQGSAFGIPALWFEITMFMGGPILPAAWAVLSGGVLAVIVMLRLIVRRLGRRAP